MMNEFQPQVAVPCTLMRGGTSKGPFFKLSDLPLNRQKRDGVLLAIMGSPDARQIDGLGGATSLTSKVAIVAPSLRKGIDVDYLFAQVSVDQPIVDTEPPCGNMLAGVAPFAIESGMVEASDGETRVRIFNINTNSSIEALVQTPGRQVRYDGDERIDGVPGTAAPIRLNFMDIVGSKCGAMLPTGRPREDLMGVEATLIDVAMPMVLFRARDLGITGYERPAELDANRDLFSRIEAMRREAGRRMGMGDVSGSVVPKVALLAEPAEGGTISSRYLVPHATHAAHAVTGGICVASASVVAGTVAHDVAVATTGPDHRMLIEHPSGCLEVALTTRDGAAGVEIVSGGVVRTARRIMSGVTYVPAAVWGG